MIRRLHALNTVGNIARPKAIELCAFAVRPPAGFRSVESAIAASSALVISCGLMPLHHSVMSDTKVIKGVNIQSTIIEPMTLKSTWPIAVRFAARLPLREARIGVMVVPILPPRIIAHPSSKLIQPCEHMIRVIANVAAELYATIVRIMPKKKKISTEPKPRVV